MARVLLLSNGHGEDLSGAILGEQLKGLGHTVEALPLVGLGAAYKNSGIFVIDEGKEFSTGGIGYTSMSGRLVEFLEGQAFYLLKRVVKLLRMAHFYELIVVVGDVVPVLAAWLSRRPVVTYLVAYSSHYEGRLCLPWPCGACLKSQRFLEVYSRDQLTSNDLSIQLGRIVKFLGNPFMDMVFINQPALPSCRRRLGILPGSRRPEVDKNLLLILSLIELLPEMLIGSGEITLDLALVSALDDVALHHLALSKGWALEGGLSKSSPLRIKRGLLKMNVRRGAFAQILQNSDLLVCMAGTATEQTVGLAKPVVQLVGQGPQFTNTFAEAQRRLLGPTVFCVHGSTGDQSTLRKTASLILDLLARVRNDQKLIDECAKQASIRLGVSGGAHAMANAISKLIH
ncbi:lipid-A-disaccharide synthase-related protein [Prochlorococcus sp. MIT 1300]|uniref:lipid-A-disaccharide synthase-related protein n=1 Tax=Prochlorococcus sp. MIT 1300 TaxID=3096218 RepID=UPI002A765A88|nr:lipid-A-disaccharide synthase-related protein [Prochlorococcus sp. MIT 1300]